MRNARQMGELPHAVRPRGYIYYNFIEYYILSYRRSARLWTLCWSRMPMELWRHRGPFVVMHSGLIKWSGFVTLRTLEEIGCVLFRTRRYFLSCITL